MAPEDPPAPDREEPVGAPVVRGDPEIAGGHAERAERFDPDDPESLADAAAVVRSFAADPDAADDELSVLRGAAACAALVRGEGSYKAAAARAGEGVTVSFLRTWGRVHDLPIAIRRHIATGDVPPTAAQQIARVEGHARFVLAWALLDNDLTVETVRTIASQVADGASIERALADHGVAPGELTVRLPTDLYRELHRVACLEGERVDDVLAAALDDWLEE